MIDKDKAIQRKARTEFIAQNPEAQSYFYLCLEKDLMTTPAALEATKEKFEDAYLLFLLGNEKYYLKPKAKAKAEEIMKRRNEKSL